MKIMSEDEQVKSDQDAHPKERKKLSVNLVDKLILETSSLIRHNLNNERDVLLNTKFNVQRIAAYQCIVDLVGKITNVFETIFSDP